MSNYSSNKNDAYSTKSNQSQCIKYHVEGCVKTNLKITDISVQYLSTNMDLILIELLEVTNKLDTEIWVSCAPYISICVAAIKDAF